MKKRNLKNGEWGLKYNMREEEKRKREELLRKRFIYTLYMATGR